MADALDTLLSEIASCRVCLEQPKRTPLPHEPRPVLQASSTARIAICGQAPGTRVHASGKPFTDPSGDRLRDWMAVDHDTFYDATRIAIVPMGFCFPGLDAKGGDLPPRPECAALWRQRVFDQLPALRILILVGSYAQKWHLGKAAKANLTDTVAAWAEYVTPTIKRPYHVFPTPHPSWRNNAWLKRNPWFEEDMIPQLRANISNELENT